MFNQMAQSITIIFVLLKCSSYFKKLLYSNTRYSNIRGVLWSMEYSMSLFKFLLGLTLILQLHTSLLADVMDSLASQQSWNPAIYVLSNSLGHPFISFSTPTPLFIFLIWILGIISRLMAIRILSRVVIQFTRFVFHLLKQMKNTCEMF